MNDTTLVDPAVRPIPAYSRRFGTPDEAIRSRLATLYRDRAAAGLEEPCREEMFEACALKSWRVEQLRDEMRRAGEIPMLRPRRRRERTDRPRRGPEDPPPAYPLEPTVREHRQRERRLGLAIAREVPSWD